MSRRAEVARRLAVRPLRSWAAAIAGRRSTAYLPQLPSVPEEISSLRSRQRRVDRKRREALDRLVDLKGSVRVFCRVRPPVHTNSLHAQSPVIVEQERMTVWAAGIKKEFGADRVFGQESTQEDVFEEVKPILRFALDGHNVCILAYDQTGMGKTYTMVVGGLHCRKEPTVISSASCLGDPRVVLSRFGGRLMCLLFLYEHA
uniref:Kinesin motor domain-containing protein n=1 Tax=Zea mays TaxID=4577 RepID=A0A804LY52_MAIZE